jgi:mannose-1-phosphate guanylyltransferase
MLLAAGRATRLGSLSSQTPKVLHRIGEEILLDRLIRQLKEVGVSEILINTHHLSDAIRKHVSHRSDRGAFEITYEPELLGTLGSVRANRSFFGASAGYVLHADNFFEGSLTVLPEAYSGRAPGVWGAMLTFDSPEPSQCGVVVTDEGGVVIDFFEKVAYPPVSQASAATYLFGPEVFDFLETTPASADDISLHLLPLLRGRLVAAHTTSRVVDIGTPAGLALAQDLVGHDHSQTPRG